MDVELFYDRLTGISDRSLYTYSYGLNSFFKFIGLTKLVDTIIVPTFEVKETPYLLENEVMDLIDKIDDLKFKCLYLSMYECALRVSEALNLNWSDFNPDMLSLRVKRLKSKRRIVSSKPISRKLVRMLSELKQKYIDEGLEITDDTPIFITYSKKRGGYGRMTRQYAEKKFREYAKKYGIDKIVKNRGFEKATTHILRHSRITDIALKTNGDLTVMQKVSDHQNPANLMVYTHIAGKIIREKLGVK